MRSVKWAWGGVVVFTLVLSGTAFAQGDLPWKIDPGSPPGPETVGNNSPWSLVTIPGLQPGSTLGAVAVDPSGTVWVWAIGQEPVPASPAPPGAASAILGELDPGDMPPTGPGGGPSPPTVVVSTLYEFVDGHWRPWLQLTGETGASVFPATSGELFVSTNLPDGSVRVYHSDGYTWERDALPGGVIGAAGSFAGTERVFFRAGDFILARHGDNDWRVEVVSKNLGTGGELIGISGNEMMAPCDNGQFLWNGFDWSWHQAASESHVHGAWGQRDVGGILHLFATGSNLQHNDPMMWRFFEDVPGHLNGRFESLTLDASTAHSLPSSGSEVWGSQPHDIYATGCCDHCGQLLHFDGTAWSRIIPMPDMPPAVGISGTVAGEVWVSLANGNMLHLPAPALVPAGGPEIPAADPLPVLKRPPAHLTVRDGGAGVARFAFTLPSEGVVAVTVYDLAGRRVQTLASDWMSAGDHELTWNAKGVPSGIYFCRLAAGETQITKRVLVHK